MDFADTYLDRRMHSTDTNEYATGRLDENEWRANMIDYDHGARFDDYDFAEREPEMLYNGLGT
jgi:hypothetical protein